MSGTRKVMDSQSGLGMRKAGTQVFGSNLGKALGDDDRLVDFGRASAAALGQAASATAKGAQSMHDEFYAYSKPRSKVRLR